MAQSCMWSKVGSLQCLMGPDSSPNELSEAFHMSSGIVSCFRNHLNKKKKKKHTHIIIQRKHDWSIPGIICVEVCTKAQMMECVHQPRNYKTIWHNENRSRTCFHQKVGLHDLQCVKSLYDPTLLLLHIKAYLNKNHETYDAPDDVSMYVVKHANTMNAREDSVRKRQNLFCSYFKVSWQNQSALKASYCVWTCKTMSIRNVTVYRDWRGSIGQERASTLLLNAGACPDWNSEKKKKGERLMRSSQESLSCSTVYTRYLGNVSCLLAVELF